MSTDASNEDDNPSRQRDEIEALTAIYGDDFKTLDEENKIYEVRIKNEIKSIWSVLLRIMLVPGYPSYDQPVFEIAQCPLLNAEDEIQLIQECQQIAQENRGESYLFQWIEQLREIVEKKANDYQQVETLQAQEQETELKVREELLENLANAVEEIDIQNNPVYVVQECENDTNFKIFHGEPFTDRKSTFQAHLAVVTSKDQVEEVLFQLKSNRKIANASHNIMAYRIFNAEKNSYVQDCDDDGENAAGSRLLHLLQIIDAKNVVIVVTRWYGGLLLGPDRFKHINNCARNLLASCGYIDIKLPLNNKDSKNKSRIKAKKYR